MKKLFFAWALLVVALPLLAQRNLQPGYLITNEGDTLRGFIHYAEKTNTPNSVLFSTNKKGEKLQRFTPSEIREVDISGIENYRQCSCTISQAALDLDKLGSIPDTSSKIGLIWLRKVRSNKDLQLFSYTDRIRTRFYILPSGATQPTELLYYTYINPGDNSFVEITTYRDQLKAHMPRQATDELWNARWLRAKYNHFDLGGLVEQADSENVTVRSKKVAPRTLRWVLYGGVHMGLFRFAGDEEHLATAYEFDRSYGPVFGGGFDIFINPRTRKGFFRQELAYFHNRHYGLQPVQPLGIQQEYFLRQQVFSLGTNYLYNVYNGRMIRMFGGAGIAFNRVITNENKVVRLKPRFDDRMKPYDFKKANISGNARMGIGLGKTAELSLVYIFPVTNTTYYGSFADHFQYWQLRFGVLFLKAKTKA